MPRFFFHIHDGEQKHDHEGVELQSPEKAHSEAMITTGETLKDINGKFGTGRWHMRVVDEHGEMVSEIAVSVRRRGSA